MAPAIRTRPLTRGELARRAGCHAETVRYYERIGLLPPPARSAAGHRHYAAADQRRLRFILRGRELGFAIDELRALMSLVDSKSYSCADIHDRAAAHLAGIRSKIADLQRLERTLATTMSACHATPTPDCPIIDALWAD